MRSDTWLLKRFHNIYNYYVLKPADWPPARPATSPQKGRRPIVLALVRSRTIAPVLRAFAALRFGRAYQENKFYRGGLYERPHTSTVHQEREKEEKRIGQWGRGPPMEFASASKGKKIL